MKKIKKIIRRLAFKWSALSGPRRLGLGVLLVLLFFLAYLIFRLASFTRAEVSLAAWRATFLHEAPCHDRCISERENLTAYLIPRIKDSKRLAKILKRYLSESETPQFKAALLNLVALSYDGNKAPEWLREYMNTESIDPLLAAAIAKNFSLRSDVDSLVKSWRKILEQDAGPSSEKISALRAMTMFGAGQADDYFAFLGNQADPSVRRTALAAIARLAPQERLATQIYLLSDFIFSDYISLAEKREAIWLLSEYYDLFTSEVLSVWLEIYNSQKIDKFSRVWALDLLSKYGVQAPRIDISQEEWSEYFNSDNFSKL